ncbi:hypothetical protein, partial [Burkholderia multivorans]|uniref:hypothetical protein n=1 Tax=Burkholderia multivorans TaxID=87883 RepID=UPI001C6164BC
NSYVNLKIATCLVRYADDRLIDQRFPRSTGQLLECADLFSESSREQVSLGVGRHRQKPDLREAIHSPHRE